MDDDIKPKLQLVWGVLLVLAGVGLIFRIPQVMPQIRQIEYFAAVIPFIYFCMYFVAVFLIAGGARKIYLNSNRPKSGTPPGP
jgi:bacteriorhodopsin